MLEIKDGKIYVEGVETIDPELIGMAFLDFAEQMKNKVICNDPVLCIGEDWSSSDIVGVYLEPKYDQDYQDKQRLADEIVNDFEDW